MSQECSPWEFEAYVSIDHGDRRCNRRRKVIFGESVVGVDDHQIVLVFQHIGTEGIQAVN